MDNDVNKTLRKSARPTKPPVTFHINDLAYQYQILMAQWRYILGRECTEGEKTKVKMALIRSMARRVGNRKYAPHQGKKERARRVKQITGAWVDEA